MPIVINNIETRIGQNLWEALYHLRHSRDEQALWADAICINQHDLVEKARVVPQMSLIYRRAAEVIIWLGPHQAPKEVDLKKMARWAFAAPNIDRTYHEDWWHEAVPWLFDLMHANYWKRTWVIQEIGEAVRLSVHFGKQSLSWDAFSSVVLNYRKCFPRALWTDRISEFEDLRKSRREGEIYALTDLISTFRDTFCKVSHDKIYAFLGMAADDSPNFIPAGYNKSLAEVYSDVMQFLSGSTIDVAVKEVELVHMSALARRLLARETGTTVDIDEKPRSVLRHAEPYTYYVKNHDSTELEAKTAYHKVWHEWEYKRHQQKTTYWLPTGTEHLDLWTNFDPAPWQSATLKAKGIILGQIESFGPTVEMFLTSNRVSKAWKTTIIQGFPEKPVQKNMIALYERLLDIVGQEAAAKSIDSTTAFRSKSGSNTTQAADSARLFIGSNGFLGIASPGVHVGDHVVHFWKSSASAVVRKDGDSSKHGEYSVVGRCSIVKEGYSHDWDTPQDKTKFLSGDESSIYSHMDINTLTFLTLNSLDLKSETPEATRIPRVHKL
ncbi:hypothetical protein MMC18_000969 [Xylographa bjoerkii]|nr:hypothetical protein [Xylographa bjoerkii]